MTLWKASSDDVWYTGDNLHMSLQSWEFVNKAESFSLAFESKRTQTTTTKKHVVCVVISEHAMSCYSHLRLFNHFFFLSWPFNLPCAHLGNFLFLCLCLLWIWLSRDNHLASMVLLSPSGVEETHQYRWLMMLLCQFPIIAQSFCFAAASSFLRRPTNQLKLVNMNIISSNLKMVLTLSNMPDIIVVSNGWIIFTQPLIDLLVSISHKNFNSQTLLLEKV